MLTSIRRIGLIAPLFALLLVATSPIAGCGSAPTMPADNADSDSDSEQPTAEGDTEAETPAADSESD